MKLRITLVLSLLTYHVGGNVEKTIFIAPPNEILPNDASLDNLLLLSLSEGTQAIRTRLNASFPSESSPKGVETWLKLEGIIPGRRYEVRICWLATQPTSFWIYSHPISSVLDDPVLMSSLSEYAFARHATLSEEDIKLLQSRHLTAISSVASSESTALFLQIYAAADYYTLNRTLMEIVPPVLVDIILDPYILGILPKSLLPTVAYIVLIAVIAWFLSGWIYQYILLPLAVPLIDQGRVKLEEKKTE